MFEGTEFQLPAPGAQHHDEQADDDGKAQPANLHPAECDSQFSELNITKRQIQKAPTHHQAKGKIQQTTTRGRILCHVSSCDRVSIARDVLLVRSAVHRL